MNADVAIFLDNVKTGNPPAVGRLLTTSPRRIRARKVHGAMPGYIASRAILPMPGIGTGRLGGTRPKAISARKERLLPRFF